MSTPCQKLARSHLEPCLREVDHEGPCWPWLVVEFPPGIYRVTIVNANPDGTAGPLAMRCEATGGRPNVYDMHLHVVNEDGYPEKGLYPRP